MSAPLSWLLGLSVFLLLLLIVVFYYAVTHKSPEMRQHEREEFASREKSQKQRSACRERSVAILRATEILCQTESSSSEEEEILVILDNIHLTSNEWQSVLNGTLDRESEKMRRAVKQRAHAAFKGRVSQLSTAQ